MSRTSHRNGVAGEDIWMGKGERDRSGRSGGEISCSRQQFQLKVKDGRWAEAEKGIKKQSHQRQPKWSTDAEIGDTRYQTRCRASCFTQGMKLKEGELYTPEDPEIARRFKEKSEPETIIPRLGRTEKLKNQMTGNLNIFQELLNS